MTEEWRTLLYPLGLMASVAFSARFIVQWIQSEIKQASHVTCTFWKLSIVGNILLAIHTFIQVHYPLCLVQGCNLIISWRNIDLMRKPQPRASFVRTISLLVIISITITLGFVLQGYLCFGFIDWVRTPRLPWQSITGSELPLYWHLAGSAGIFLFSSRFWVQWWQAEKQQKSTLTPSFWWISLVGTVLALVYFIRLHDIVNVLGFGTSIFPYLRNLMLLRANTPRTTS